MDEFGVLVESIGFRAQGKSAPMANLKNKTNHGNGFPRDIAIDLGFNTNLSSINRPKSPYNSSPINGLFVDDLDGIFPSHNNQKTQNYGGFDGTDDVFGGSVSNSNPSGGDSAFDLNSVFKSLNNSSSKFSVSGLYDDGDDIFGGMPGLKSSDSGSYKDVFGSMASPPKHSDSVDDLIGTFDGMGLKSNGSRRNSANSSEVDDLIPGFGVSRPSSNGAKFETIHSQQSGDYSSESTSTLAEEPFVVFESSPSSSGPYSVPLAKDAGESSFLSSIDELEDFAMGSARNNANQQANTAMHDAHKREHKAREDVLHHKQRKIREEWRTSEMENDLESFFSVGAQPTGVPKPWSTVEDPAFDILFQKKGGSEVERTSSGTSSRKKAAPITDFDDNFSSLFGEAAASEQFREIKGESEERRRARLNNHMRTQERMAKALAQKNQRDIQNQQEQDERHRLAKTLDDDIKHWAAGKEGNLRALLSSLQYVLWPECGWQPVSLTDLITSTSVKKVYYKATLCVHPDKVQQKGANIQQKYIAEKVFDRLKEAWNKFNAEELR